MAEPVAKFFKNKLRLRSRSEFRGYDVIGYNKEERTFYLVECKIGGNITKLGQAYGQILAYISKIYDNGYEFIKKSMINLGG